MLACNHSGRIGASPELETVDSLDAPPLPPSYRPPRREGRGHDDARTGCEREVAPRPVRPDALAVASLYGGSKRPPALAAASAPADRMHPRSGSCGLLLSPRPEHEDLDTGQPRRSHAAGWQTRHKSLEAEPLWGRRIDGEGCHHDGRGDRRPATRPSGLTLGPDGTIYIADCETADVGTVIVSLADASQLSVYPGRTAHLLLSNSVATACGSTSEAGSGLWKAR